MPNQPPQLTLIMPAYNVAAYIGDALDSIAVQNPAFDEVIIVDDGSTDDTAQILRKHPNTANTQIITTQNQGLGPARNTGIEAARGDYLYFLDSDDMLDPAFTQTIHHCIRTHDAPDLILFAGQQFIDGGTGTKKLDDFRRGCVVHGINGEEAIARLARTGGIEPNAYLYISKRDLWLRNNLRFKPILHEDEDVLYPLILAAKSVSILDQALHHRRVRPGSIMSSAKTKAHSDGLLEVTRTLCGLCRSYKTHNRIVKNKLRHKTIRHACRYMRTCHKAGVPVNHKIMLQCARDLHSLRIGMGMIGAGTKALFTRPEKRA